MRRFSRLDRSIGASGLLRGSTPLYTCSACRAFATSPVSREQTPIAEKVRQKLWGTDKPPGLKDPYGDASVLDRSKDGEAAVEEEETEVKPRRVKKSKAPTDPNYVPADTMEGLEWVGGHGHWWKRNWDPVNTFEGFLPSERVSDGYEATACLHRAVVEVFAFHNAGRSVKKAKYINMDIDDTADVQLVPEGDGAALKITDGRSAQDLVASFTYVPKPGVESNPTESEEDVAADRSTEDPLATEEEVVDETAAKEAPTESEEDVAADRSEVDPLAEINALQSQIYQGQVASWDPSWLQISLADPTIKFAVIKRTMQLTGIRVSDANIQYIKNVQGLLDHLITPPKAKKVTEALAQSEKFADLPNVKIYDRRVTPIDQEIQVGRWKVIEQELKKKGLPVTGRN